MTEVNKLRGRNSSMELLRILCMVMIVAHHYSTYGFYAEALYQSPNKSFIEILGAGGQTGVNVFVLISGYYMVTGSYSFKKFMSFAGQVWTYAWGAFLVFLLFFPQSPLIRGEYVSLSLLPLSFGHYWFATCYLVLMLLSPFLNTFIRASGRGQTLGAIALLLVIYILLPTLTQIHVVTSTMARFIILYLTAGYIRLYMQGSSWPMAFWLWCFCLLGALLIGWDLAFNWLGQSRGDPALMDRANIFARNDLFVYAWALCLFMVFLRSAAWHSPWVNRLSSLTFGVYLFHDNQQIRSIWQGIFHTSQWMDSPWLPLHALAAITAVFLAGALVELLRQKTVARLWDWAIDRMQPWWDRLKAWVLRSLSLEHS